MLKEGDIVFVSNPDREYEKQMGIRNHRAFFGRVLMIDTYGMETVVDVTFPRTACGEAMEWSYDVSELSLASEPKNLTLEEFSNRYGVSVNGEYLRWQNQPEQQHKEKEKNGMLLTHNNCT